MRQFVSEPLVPVGGKFDASGMARGEPGVPERFRWRKKEFAVAEVLEAGRVFGDCTHGSGERYLRRHTWRIRTTDGSVFHVSFQRTGPAALRAARWWLQGIE